MKADFWSRWLLFAGVLLALFGLATAFFNQSSFFDSLFNSNVDPVFWGTAGVPAASRGFQRWVYAVLGATIAGWGVTLAFLAYHPFRKRELWCWNCILAGMLAWYLPDTLLSLQAGVVFNAVFNTLLLILVLLPLVITRREFTTPGSRRRPRHPSRGRP